MKVIHWKNYKTGKTGQGQPQLDKNAEAWVKELNAKYPDIHHRLEED